jgi:RNA polymerase sigma-70 factor (ECF subfamily)
MEHYNMLLQLVREGDREAFALLFRTFYKDLVLFAGTLLNERADCEDVVQGVLMHLWEDRRGIVIQSSLKAFLLRSVRNACLDLIRHRAVVRRHEGYALSLGEMDEEALGDYVLYSDLQRHLEEAMGRMPALLREAFVMNRTDGLKYREIAQALKVSERTVEVRIGKAIQWLRRYLKEFLCWVAVWFVDC